MAGKALKRVEVKQWVVAEMLKHEHAGKGRYMTCAKIARLTKRTPSTKFRAILTEMLWNETLIAVDIPIENNVSQFKRLYELNPDKYPPYFPPLRTIRINGQQMTLEGV